LKRLNIFIIRSFIGPFIITFSIAMFFLIMQFLWKYVDDLMGKGLEINVLLEMLFYVSASLIPMALLLAVLFSSIMTYGNLAEHNELTAFKSSGLSLFKVMRPMFIFVVLLSVSAFFFSNYILPIANLKWRAIYWDVLEKKPAFNLKEGIFYKDIDDYHIKVDKKEADGTLRGILIYDLSQGIGHRKIRAREGIMLKSKNEDYLFLQMKSGIIYEQVPPEKFELIEVDFQKSFFEEAVVKFDMSGFDMEKSDEDLFKQDFEMMNFMQLEFALDSLKKLNDTLDMRFANSLKQNIIVLNNGFITLPPDNPLDTLAADTTKEVKVITLDSLHGSELSATYLDAQTSLRDMKNSIFAETDRIVAREESLNEYRTAWHKKFTLSYAVIVLFFIGAPLGAIIRKGGLGMPLVFAVIFFLLYYIITMIGENMVESGVIVPWKGLWLSAFFLTPLALFLTYKAVNDSALFDWDVYKRFFGRIFGGKRPKNTETS
jgi:lipopolysaccharide export system permease protein